MIDKIILSTLIHMMQEKLVQFVSVASGALSAELKKSDSATRQMLVEMVEEIVQHDPEFVLKVMDI